MIIGADQAIPALIGAMATIMVAVIGLVGIMIQVNRNSRKVDDNAVKLDDIVKHVNNVEAQTDGSGRKLTMREEIREGFKNNSAEHQTIFNHLAIHDDQLEVIEKEIEP